MFKHSSLFIKVFLTLFIFFTSLLNAQPTSKAQAKKLVTNWFNQSTQPLSTSMSSTISDITTFTNSSSETLYHVVSLNPDGFVVIAGDDLVEPIVAFAPYGKYEDSLDNPMGALIKGDVPSRVSYQREQEEKRVATSSFYQSNSYSNKAKDKWAYLSDTSKISTIKGVISVSDVYVAPLLKTLWNQEREKGKQLCYNLYTPNNYPSGCVATALSQILKYFKYPTTSLGDEEHKYYIDGYDNKHYKQLMGGDGEGGAYNWNIMSDGPRIDNNESRDAIGKLMSDAGISVGMRYAKNGSGTYHRELAYALVDTFNYENADYIGLNNRGLNYEVLMNVLNTNCDASLPVTLAILIEETNAGHAVIVDGYGYNLDTLYHHINVGWGGKYNAWYNLPIIDTKNHKFDLLDSAVYNIYSKGRGEIISGRVTDKQGVPISGAEVSTSFNIDAIMTVTTNEQGIYALTRLPSDSSYTVEVKKDGYIFDTQMVEVGSSSDYWNVGNRWGVNFENTGENIKKIFSPSLIHFLLN